LEKTKKGVKEVKLDMNRNLKIATVLIILVVVALGSYLWATANAPTPPSEPRRLPFERFSQDREWFISSVGDIELYYTLNTVISSINATLLVFLLITYLDIYKALKSEFTLGLIIFSMILLLYALVSNPLMQSIFGFQGIGLGPFVMLPDLFTCLALAVLLYLTMK
jgi:hypothetical protein